MVLVTSSAPTSTASSIACPRVWETVKGATLIRPLWSNARLETPSAQLALHFFFYVKKGGDETML